MGSYGGIRIINNGCGLFSLCYEASFRHAQREVNAKSCGMSDKKIARKLKKLSFIHMNSQCGEVILWTQYRLSWKGSGKSKLY
ncbi:hypothetical protein [Candidatus Protochlamydia sp. W-9]|uniref:hypothetical protein n=1 Tax=Candidatus Protochlamydia sp. W-9 TaxID=1785087 RepID=UPI00096A8092|nr:hypothetical protein [Candidatus Protochlamydia sp. W-9]